MPISWLNMAGGDFGMKMDATFGDVNPTPVFKGTASKNISLEWRAHNRRSKALHSALPGDQINVRATQPPSCLCT